MTGQFLRAAATVALMAAGAATPARAAGEIEGACRAAGRAADAGLCACLQQVADQTLDRRDQRAAARFFADPDRAQEVRMSSRARDSEFWDRYIAFAAQAEASCARP